jgi:hypothetical protein
MRAGRLKELMPSCDWVWVDTDHEILQSSHLWQTVAYRLKTGRAVDRLNRVVENKIGSDRYDLIWVDKAIFLRAATVRLLRKLSRRMVHYTPDTAFANGRSRHFDETAGLYDLLVTTKAFDVPEYVRLAGRDTVHLTTQGFDKAVHFPMGPNSARRDEAFFVGLAEPARESCISALMESGITVRLAGRDWDKFVRRWGKKRHLKFEGHGIFGADYARVVSESWVGLGLLSKRFGELHTTRTFEIPACGAVLATEANADTTRFFNDDEALFFRDEHDLVMRITSLFADATHERLSVIASKGRQRVLADCRDNSHILSGVLADPKLAL